MGCNGGWMSATYNYIKDNGAMTEADYPYTATEKACEHD